MKANKIAILNENNRLFGVVIRRSKRMFNSCHFLSCSNRPCSLDEDIKTFVNWMEPTAEEIDKREEVKQRVFDIIETTCGVCTPALFGSTASGLFSPLSDIDIVVLGLEAEISECMTLLSASLMSKTYVTQLKVLSEARVSKHSYVSRDL